MHTTEDLSEDLAQIARLRMQRRFREARWVLRELRAEFDGHPDLDRGRTRAGLPAVPSALGAYEAATGSAVNGRHTMSIMLTSPLSRPRRRRPPAA